MLVSAIDCQAQGPGKRSMIHTDTWRIRYEDQFFESWMQTTLPLGFAPFRRPAVQWEEGSCGPKRHQAASGKGKAKGGKDDEAKRAKVPA